MLSRMRLAGSAVVLFALACNVPAATPTRTETETPQPPAQAAEPGLPQLGTSAPSFSLTTLDGTTVALADAVAKGPVVLVFGSFT